ncbi:hypothetical protein [Companilactobacillus furfuricola]|uniref:hypothetical protein n=1 Tax=Companilactobacillus furfuricola TaxID=1462575 RepID=UPI000F774BF3|nr:hypothetical protein [Companilactobacillus furfuricola]
MLNWALFIIGSIMTIITIVLAIKNSKSSSKTSSSKKLTITVAFLIIIVLSTSGILTFHSYQQTVSAHRETAKQQAKQIEKQKEQNDPRTTDSRAQISKVNQAIADSLKEDQKDAKNPPIPDPRYAYPDKIQSVKYLGNKQLKVQVTDVFLQLSNVEKDKAINYAQDCAISGFIMSIKAVSGEQINSGFDTTIENGTTILGHSTKDNHRQYQWNQQ